MQALARSRSSSEAVPVGYPRWHNLQQWLAAGERRVVVPFAEKLAELVLAIAVPQRRDFGALLTLIGAHALLHRASRDRDHTGAILATTMDYATVRELVADVFAEAIEATVKLTVRETVDTSRRSTLSGLHSGRGVRLRRLKGSHQSLRHNRHQH
jgi:hypothetical protein